MKLRKPSGDRLKTLKIYGPPGTGKTHTLLEYFEKELLTTKPDRIGFVTFTRAARAEVLSRSSLPEEELPFVKTLHATCYRALGLDQGQLVTRKDLVGFGKSLGVHLTGFMPDLFSLESVIEAYQTPTKADRLLQLNHLGRHRGLKLLETLKDAPLELDHKYAIWFTKAYREWKTAAGKEDYTDLLTGFLSRGTAPDLDALFVDEAQDLSWLQWQVAHKLAERCQRVYICGDDDQTIFRWAGASASLFNFEPADEVRVLPQSFRLPRQVHAVGMKIIKRIKVRQEKEFRPRDAEGEYRPIGALDYPHLSGPSTLVLYRNFHRGTALSGQLENLGVPFTGANSVLTDPDVRLALMGWHRVKTMVPIPLLEARAMLAYSVEGRFLPGTKERIEPRAGEISATAILTSDALNSELSRVMPKLPRLGYLMRCLARNTAEEVLNTKTQLLSIHQSKGREAHTVVLDLDMARRTYESYMQEPDDEHRVQYVAVTRAKERLLTLLPTDSMSYII